MKVNLKTTLSVCALINTVISLLLVWSILDLSKESEKLELIERNRYLMFEKANELKQTSDDLTRFARLYAITGNETFRDTYFHILNIRNGKAKRPFDYGGMYWEIAEPLRSQRHPLGSPLSLKSEMQKLPYLPFEFEKLAESESNSNKLVMLELEAFNAMGGLFNDDKGGYTVQRTRNQQLAINLLISEQYKKEKESIMRPIDDFFHSLISRTEKAVSFQNELVDSAFNRIFVFLFGDLLVLIFIAFFVQRRVLNPILSLTKTIEVMKSGSGSLSRSTHYDDEIGSMTKQFFEMKDTLDSELLKTKELAITDPLTGVKNRRYFYEVGESILKIASRSKEPLSILMLDIDRFKVVNDTYGHIIGDDLLIDFSNKVGSQVRESDILARYGGEEFAILLPKTDVLGAMEIAEKIRRLVESNPFVDGKISIPITVSIGVAELREEPLMRLLMQRVDEALYEAKESGRNKVIAK